MIQGVVFDMDGLMFDTEVIYSRAWQEVSVKFGYDMSVDFINKLLGLNYSSVKQQMIEHFGQDFPIDSIYREKYDWVKNYFNHNDIPLKSGLFELLKYLYDNRIRMAVASSSNQIDVMNYLEKAKVKQYFNKVICGDMVHNGKPDPEIYLTSVKELNLRPECCMALEDAPNGVIAAHVAGLKVVMIPDLVVPDDSITKLLYKRVDSLSQVIPLINQN